MTTKTKSPDCSDPQNCPNCENVGWYMVPDSEGQPTMEQCQWCYTVANSVFNSLLNETSPPVDATEIKS